jgi:tetratricopeptide (TPR) repeat protein
MGNDQTNTATLGIAALQAMLRGDRREAGRLAHMAVDHRPQDANGLQVLGALALDAGDHLAALQHLAVAARAAPNQPNILNMLGIAQRRAGAAQEASASFRHAGELGSAQAWFNLGNLEVERGAPKAAIAAYESALRLAPGDARSHAALAFELERMHELGRATAHAQDALRLSPRNAIAAIALARVRLREGRYEDAEATARIAAGDASATNRAIGFGLSGDACDRLGRTREAFTAFAAANELMLAQHGALLADRRSPYHVDNVRAMADFAARADFSAWPRSGGGSAPTFLVGFPRSGTTLLEQVLSSHGQVSSMEERECLSQVVADLALAPARLDGLSPGETAARCAAYWAAVETIGATTDQAAFVDKLPLNIVFLPVIRRIFPDAKVIVAVRDPRDVLLSCFQQRFVPNVAMAQLLELRSAAEYFDAVMTLLEHCRARLGARLLLVRYEDVVDDLESQARRLCGFLELPFDAAMLRFRETALSRDIRTPSARQVIEPLYRRSMGRWRRYAEDLAPVLPDLERWAVGFGYA